MTPAGDRTRERTVLTWVGKNMAKLTALTVGFMLLSNWNLECFGQVSKRSNGVQTIQFQGDLPVVDIPPADAEAMIQPPAGSVPQEVSAPTDSSADLTCNDPPVEQQEIINMPEEVFLGSEFTDAPLSQRIHNDGTVLGESAAPIFSTGTWFWRGQWYTEVGLVSWLHDVDSERADSILLGNAFNASGGLVQRLSSTDEQHTYEPGLRMTIGYFMGRDVANRDHNMEFQFTGFLEWEAASAISGDDVDTAILFNEPAFSDNTRQQYIYDADYNSFELNYTVRTRPGRDQMALNPNGTWTRHYASGQLRALVGGLRYISIEEKFLYQGIDTAADLTNGSYRVKTSNDLFGGHVGLDFFDTYDTWYWKVRTRVGGFANAAGRSSALATAMEVVDPLTGDTVISRSSTSQQLDESQIAVLLELGLSAAYHLRPNTTFRVGYDFTYITGLAMAPENLGFSTFPPLSTDEHCLYHGANLAFETTW